MQAMFDASISVQHEDEKLTRFWSDRWLRGNSIQELAPYLCQVVAIMTRLNRTLYQALRNRQWIRDITGPINVVVLAQYLHIWVLIQDVQLRNDQEDKMC